MYTVFGQMYTVFGQMYTVFVHFCSFVHSQLSPAHTTRVGCAQLGPVVVHSHLPPYTDKKTINRYTKTVIKFILKYVSIGLLVVFHHKMGYVVPSACTCALFN